MGKIYILIVYTYNNIFFKNEVSGEGGGILSINSIPFIINNLITQNKAGWCAGIEVYTSDGQKNVSTNENLLVPLENHLA